METTVIDRLAWHKPQMQRLIVTVQTADFLKDSSSEDLEVRGAPGIHVGAV